MKDVRRNLSVLATVLWYLKKAHWLRLMKLLPRCCVISFKITAFSECEQYTSFINKIMNITLTFQLHWIYYAHIFGSPDR